MADRQKKREEWAWVAFKLSFSSDVIFCYYWCLKESPGLPNATYACGATNLKWWICLKYNEEQTGKFLELYEKTQLLSVFLSVFLGEWSNIKYKNRDLSRSFHETHGLWCTGILLCTSIAWCMQPPLWCTWNILLHKWSGYRWQWASGV